MDIYIYLRKRMYGTYINKNSYKHVPYVLFPYIYIYKVKNLEKYGNRKNK